MMIVYQFLKFRRRILLILIKNKLMLERVLFFLNVHIFLVNLKLHFALLHVYKQDVYKTKKMYY